MLAQSTTFHYMSSLPSDAAKIYITHYFTIAANLYTLGQKTLRIRIVLEGRCIFYKRFLTRIKVSICYILAIANLMSTLVPVLKQQQFKIEAMRRSPNIFRIFGDFVRWIKIILLLYIISTQCNMRNHLINKSPNIQYDNKFKYMDTQMCKKRNCKGNLVLSLQSQQKTKILV